MKLDYHVHSHYSFDGECSMIPMLQAAADHGVENLCFTDHLDFDASGPHIPNFFARREELSALALQFSGISIVQGAEVSLEGTTCAEAAWNAIETADLDFVLGSVHVVEGCSVWAEEYYRGLDKRHAYRRYLEAVACMLPTFPHLDVLAHYDFVAKYAPYPDRAMTLDMAPEAFDFIFLYLLSHGKALEINTGSWQQARPWGLDILQRYVALGGTYITVGSDTHGAERIGARVEEALELARAAGLRYVATFRGQVPTLHKL